MSNCILTFAEIRGGALRRPSLEAVSEARRLAGRALELVDGPLDPIFAGTPRSDVWPAEPVERAPGTAFEVAGVIRDVAAQPGVGPATDPHAAVVAVPMADFADPDRDPRGPLPEPAAELAAARAALASGDRSGAAIRLAIVLRLAPALAPAVLDLAAAEPGAEFDVVRGDALRLVGRESQARRAFASAARGTPIEAADPVPPRPTEPRSEPGP